MRFTAAFPTRALALVLATFGAWGIAAAEPKPDGPSEAEVQALIGKLGDEDYDVRVAATDALAACPAGILQILEKALAESSDPETRSRVMEAQRRIVANTFGRQAAEAERAVQSAEQKHLAVLQELNERLAKVREQIEAGKELLNERDRLRYNRLVFERLEEADDEDGAALAQDRRANREAVQAYDRKRHALDAEQEELRDKIGAERSRWRLEWWTLQSRALQLKRLRDRADLVAFLGSSHLKERWDPACLAAPARFELSVCVCAEGMPLKEAVEKVAQTAGLKVVLAPGIAQEAEKPVHAILKEADVRLAVAILSRCAGVDCKADPDAGAIVIGARGEEAKE